MNCQESRRYKDAYLDRELDLVRATEIEKHLRSCADCSNLYDNSRELSAALRSSDLYFKTPARLRWSIQRSWRGETKRNSVKALPWKQWFGFAFPGAVLALVGAILI